MKFCSFMYNNTSFMKICLKVQCVKGKSYNMLSVWWIWLVSREIGNRIQSLMWSYKGTALLNTDNELGR